MAEFAAQDRQPQSRALRPGRPAFAAAPAVSQLTQMAEGLNARPQVAALQALGARLSPPVQRNRTGLPDQLKQGVESLSGLSLDDVRVHRNSALPAQLHAHAFAQGSTIHLGPGQDHHLPHEAWHVVQQKQGRVRATTQLKGGIAANTDPALEQEADVMGSRALGSVAGIAQLMQAPLLSGIAPVQCQLWRWNATAQPAQWEQVGANSNAPAPGFAGNFHGQEFDDTPYTQATDPTVRPFLGSGENFMGQSGADKQMSGRAPNANDIRVTAVKGSGMTRGSGQHEVVPTNLGGKVGKSGNEALIGAQSGFRTSTGQQLFNIDGNEVGAHTGFAPKPGSRGYTHTKGQAAAHDEMRNVTQDIIDNNVVNPDDVANMLAIQHLNITPTGQTVLNSPYLTGMTPNLHHNLGPVGPVAPQGTAPDPQRLAVAQDAQRGREAVKRRVRTHKRATGRGRSPSPPRRPIDAQGGGGGYVQNPTLQDEVEALPFMPTANTGYEYVANLTAWMSQPQRF